MKKRLAGLVKQPYFFAKKQPWLASGLLVVVLSGLVYFGSTLEAADQGEEQDEPGVKSVRVVNVGGVGQVEAVAEVVQSGRITVVAQTAGVVSNILVTEGQGVKQGERLGYISSTYDGRSSAVLQTELARKQFEQAERSLPAQLELIELQRRSAQLNEQNSEQLREVAREVLVNSQNAANDTARALDRLNEQIGQLTEINVDGSQDVAIEQLNQAKLQISGSLAQLRSGVSQSEYANDEDNPPAQLSELQREVAIVQLETQEQNARLQVEVAKLQYRLAAMQTALAYPSAPVAGVVERILVSKYEVVQPGAPLMVISANENSAVLAARVDGVSAKALARDLPSTVIAASGSFEVLPEYVSSIATDGNQYSVVFRVNEQDLKMLNGEEMVRMKLALDGDDEMVLLPVDALYAMEDRSDVFVIEAGRVVSKEVRLGRMLGSMVEVLSGVEKGQEVILDRTVVEGEEVARQE